MSISSPSLQNPRLYLNPPNSPPAQHAQPLSRTPHARAPADIINFVIAPPARDRNAFLVRLAEATGAVRAAGRRARGPAGVVDQVPNENVGVVGAAGDDAASCGVPFDTVDGAGVTLELDECLAGLSHVKNADDI